MKRSLVLVMFAGDYHPKPLRWTELCSCMQKQLCCKGLSLPNVLWIAQGWRISADLDFHLTAGHFLQSSHCQFRWLYSLLPTLWGRRRRVKISRTNKAIEKDHSTADQCRSHTALVASWTSRHLLMLLLHLPAALWQNLLEIIHCKPQKAVRNLKPFLVSKAATHSTPHVLLASTLLIMLKILRSMGVSKSLSARHGRFLNISMWQAIKHCQKPSTIYWFDILPSFPNRLVCLLVNSCQLAKPILFHVLICSTKSSSEQEVQRGSGTIVLTPLAFAAEYRAISIQDTVQALCKTGPETEFAFASWRSEFFQDKLVAFKWICRFPWIQTSTQPWPSSQT